jgi:hypothetical protein
MKHLLYLLEDAIEGINSGNSKYMKVDKGRISDLVNRNIDQGIIVLFSLKGEVVDIIYKDDITSYLKEMSLIKRNLQFGIVIHSIKEVPCEKEAYKMVLSGLKLILGKYEEC